MVQQQSIGTRPARDRQRQSRWIEIGAAMLGVVLSLGSIGYLTYRGFQDAQMPPDIVVTVKRIVPAGPGYLAEIIVRNEGDMTGAGVKVEGELQEGELAIETSEATFDFVPAGSERRGGLYFSKDPTGRTLTLRAHGMTEP